MFDKIDEIFKVIEQARDDVNILLNIANITLVDYIMIKRGSLDLPENVSLGMLADIDCEINKIKESIDSLNKLKRELLVF